MTETPKQRADSSRPSQARGETSGISSQLIGLAVLVGAWLYFTGWTYRWAYFAFFQLEVTTLDLPLESFYMAAFHVFFGSPLAILKAIAALCIVAAAAYFIIKFIHRFLKQWRATAKSNSGSQIDSFAYARSLLDEIAIALLAFAAAFWLARWQAGIDAWNDAVNDTSALPAVTIVAPKDEIAIGRLPNDPPSNPSGFRVIGDRQLYNQILGRELNQTSDPENPRVWRLLIDRGGYFYIFPALPEKDETRRPPVVMIRESDKGDRLIILSPGAS